MSSGGNHTAARSEWARNLPAFLRVFGPGLIAMVDDNDPGTVSNNIQTGAQYGTRLTWLRCCSGRRPPHLLRWPLLINRAPGAILRHDPPRKTDDRYSVYQAPLGGQRDLCEMFIFENLVHILD